MRICVIDVGTNSILLLIADIQADHTIKPVFQDTASARLGQNISSTGTIQKKNLYKTIEIIDGYCKTADTYRASKIIMVGTAPFRTAENAQEARKAIEAQSGLTLEVLTSEEEALWTYRGACSGRHLRGTVAAADIGGGSTEIIIGTEQRIEDSISLPVGAVSVAERCDPAESPDIRFRQSIRCGLTKRFPDWLIRRLEAVDSIIAIGGTATTLAWLVSGQSVYDHDAVDGMTLSRCEIDTLVNTLSGYTDKMRRQRLHLDPARADIIVPGSLILQALLECAGPDTILVSDRGLRFGILLREAHSR